MRAGPWASRAAAIAFSAELALAMSHSNGEGADLLRGRLGAVEIDVEHGHLGAQARQMPRDGGADAGAATGDQGGLRRNLHHGPPLNAPS